jgi:hypothetical protein
MVKIKAKGRVRFRGLRGHQDISAIAMFGDRVLIAGDEVTRTGNLVRALEPSGDGYRVVAKGAVPLDLPGAPIEEMDLEGLAVAGRTVFVLGSHSAHRARLDPEKSPASNRARLARVASPRAARDVVLRFECDATGRAGPVARTSLRPFLDRTEPFRSFRAIAGKENGNDAEGLAVFRGHLYVGFRGPVLSGGYAPVIRCRFGQPIVNPRVLFLALGGRGVRDLCAVAEGILVLAGPMGDAPGSYDLFFWDGRDCVPGKTARRSNSRPAITWLGELRLPKSTKDKSGAGSARPEGVAVVKDARRHWNLLVVHDGQGGGRATRYRVAKPSFEKKAPTR